MKILKYSLPGLCILFLSSPSIFAQATIPDQGLRMDVYENIPGNSVADLTGAAKFPDQPDRTEYVELFEAPTDVLDNYGVKLSGYVVPPVSGNYTFWMASDDGGALFLSSDEDPANSVMIANVPGWTSSREWGRFPEQESDPIRLEANQSYYVEALMKEQGGGDNLAVRWRLPDGTIEEPIPASRLLPFGISFEPPAIAEQPQDFTGTENGSATFSVSLSTVGPKEFQWFKNDQPIPGATTELLTLSQLSLSDDGSLIHVEISNDQGTTRSQNATLSVQPDTTAPEVVAGLNLGLDRIILTFSEPINAGTGSNTANYTITPGIDTLQADVDSEGLTVTLTVSLMELGQTYTIALNGITDTAASPNTISSGSEIEIEVTQYTPIDIGTTQNPGGSEPVPNGLLISGGGNGTGGLSDQFHFSYQQRTGDFDVRARVEGFSLLEGSLSQSAKAGWMVRENLSGNALYAAAFTTPSPIEGAFFEYRAASGSAAQRRGPYPVSYPHQWLRLKRSGSTLTAYAGPDGTSWRTLGQVSISLPSTAYVGFAVTGSDLNSTISSRWTAIGETPPNAVDVELQRQDREPLGPTSRGTNLVISEIMYNPMAESNAQLLEFVEIYNSQPFTEDLSGFRLSGDIDYTFPEGTQLTPGGFLVITRNPTTFSANYPHVNPASVLGPFSGSLPNDTGRIRLRNRTDAVLLEVEYEDANEWPTSGDGAGHSLVLANASYGQGRVEAWSASRFRGGSPGSQDLLFPVDRSRVVINEILTNSEPPQEDFIEILNPASAPQDLSGWVLTDDPAIEKFIFPDGTTLQGKSLMVLPESALGFGISSTGETVYLIHPESNRVADSVRLDGAPVNTAWGRFPNGSDLWSWMSSLSPGELNTAPATSSLVINEIMYNPISGNDADEFIEIHNPGTAELDISGWRFTDGVDWTFPAESIIPPGAYWAISPDRDRMLARYPGIDSASVMGNYSGSLSNSRERVAISQPVTDIDGNTGWALVDEVSYQDGGRWGTWSNGDGSSLELTDPHSDNRLASNWADSDDSNKSEWTTIEFTGRLDNGRNTPNEIHIMLMGAGECLVDNIEVLPSGSGNRVSNNSFESGIGGWILEGNHVHSEWYNREGFNSSRSLLLKASGGGDNGANRIEANLTSALSVNQTATLRARARWRVGSPVFLMRLYGNYLEAPGTLQVPTNLGTPAAANSQRVNNAGPAIDHVTHSPVLPRSGETVTVTARVTDPDGLDSVTLLYRRDPIVSQSPVTMRDDGLGADEIAGDGVFTGQIPGQGSGSIVAFQIEAMDGSRSESVFPEADPDLTPECLIRYNDPYEKTPFASYRFWVNQADFNEWSNRERLSNQELDITFIYEDYRVIYNAGGRYRGSPFIRPNYNTPTGSLAAFLLEMPKDDPLFGEEELNLDWLEQPGRDDTFQREKTSFWIASQLGISFSHQKYIHLTVNGSPRGQIYTDSQQPNGDYVSQWYPDNPNGEIFKIDDWFEFNDNVDREFNDDARLSVYTTVGGEKKLARYRWSWEKKSNGGLNDDHSNFFALVDAVNSPANVYTEQVTSRVNINQWMKVIALRHIVGDWDGYGYDRGKNMFMYLPEGDRWNLMLWDLDFSLGGGSRGTNADLFAANDPVVVRMFNHPPFRRAYMRAMKQAVEGPLTPQASGNIAQQNFDALRSAGVNAASPRSILSWIGARRVYIQNQLDPLETDFSVNLPANGTINANSSLVTLTGSAPVEVESILVNGNSYPVEWTTVTNWRLTLAVESGETPITVTAVDDTGATIEGMLVEGTIILDQQIETPEASIVIHEIQANPGPEFADAEFVELHNKATSAAFDLSGWRLDGIDLDFPAGFILQPGEYVVLAKNRTAFAALYGANIPVALEYPGQLQDDGEFLQLLRPSATGDEMIVVDAVNYSTRAPWPAASAGQGPSLQLRNADLDNSRVAAWGVSGGDVETLEPVEVISMNSVWRFNQSGQDLGTTWRRPDFDDSAWEDGAGLLYVESSELPGPKSTPLTLGEITYYFRTEFEHPAPNAGPLLLQLSTIVDDGAIVYLNGQEIYRVGMPAGAVGFNTLASRSVGNASLEGPFEIPGSALRPGINSIAVEVHQTSTNSSDIVFGLSLTLESAEFNVAATPGMANSINAGFAFLPQLWLNELQYGPQTSFPDPEGLQGSWVEIYNSGNSPIDLAPFSLTQLSDPTTAWNFPEGSVIQPGAFRVVRLDGRDDLTTEDDWRTSFVLNAPTAGSDPRTSSVLLRWGPAAGNPPVALDWIGPEPNLAPSRSLGAFPDGNAFPRTVFINPTPGLPNKVSGPATNSIRINEWMASNDGFLADPTDGAFDDWIELFNPSSADVNLSGYSLSDDPANPDQWSFPSGAIIPAGGYLLVWADNDPDQTGPDTGYHTNFRLSAGGEIITLSNPAGVIVDRVEFGPMGVNVSFGRDPNGDSETIIEFAQPTPGEANKTSPVSDIELTLEFSAGIFTLQWQSQAGMNYQVEIKSSLEDASWSPVTPTVSGSGEVITWTDDTALNNASSTRFYRVRIVE